MFPFPAIRSFELRNICKSKSPWILSRQPEFEERPLSCSHWWLQLSWHTNQLWWLPTVRRSVVILPAVVGSTNKQAEGLPVVLTHFVHSALSYPQHNQTAALFFPFPENKLGSVSVFGQIVGFSGNTTSFKSLMYPTVICERPLRRRATWAFSANQQ